MALASATEALALAEHRLTDASASSRMLRGRALKLCGRARRLLGDPACEHDLDRAVTVLEQEMMRTPDRIRACLADALDARGRVRIYLGRLEEAEHDLNHPSPCTGRTWLGRLARTRVPGRRT
ncbi:hypothetical protein OIE67_21200 [Nonomuraea fuscirosea]|uniref:hypothetical protein n=1 Tax=Nonomuraea fuscirosea TaxID=1291556 RepID=UPI002DD8522C|nr:hypothetical protein [Nonomuraea fuscirosea]WSA57035.1 hypothetical protein OIE67_21200 [Nonomuraea fuscirosea]